MTQERLFILNCLRAFLHGRPLPETNLQFLDWDTVIRQSQANRVFPLVIHVLERDGYLAGLPHDKQIELHSVLMRSEWELQNKLSEFKQVRQLFQKNDIRLIPLKGIALSYLVYNKTPLRLMGDIDFLIEERDLERSQNVLLGEGFVLNEAKNRWHTKVMMDIFGRWDFIRGEMVVDVQWLPKFFVEDEFVTWDCESARKRAVPFREVGENVWMLSAMDQISYLIFQIINDFQINVVYLIQFLDLALMMNKYQITRELILQASSLYSTSVQNRISDILSIVEDLFFTDKSHEDFQPASAEFIECFFELSKTPQSGFAIQKITSLIHSPWEKLKFLAGYFVPGKKENYLDLWKRQFSSLLRLIARL